MPDLHWFGTTNFYFRGHDGMNHTENYTQVTIIINNVNDPPLVSNF